MNIFNFIFFLYLWFDYYYDDTNLKVFKLVLAFVSTPSIIYEFYFVLGLRQHIFKYILVNSLYFLIPTLCDIIYRKTLDYTDLYKDDFIFKFLNFFIGCDKGHFNLYLNIDMSVIFEENEIKWNNKKQNIKRLTSIEEFLLKKNYSVIQIKRYNTDDIVPDYEDAFPKLRENNIAIFYKQEEEIFEQSKDNLYFSKIQFNNNNSWFKSNIAHRLENINNDDELVRGFKKGSMYCIKKRIYNYEDIDRLNPDDYNHLLVDIKSFDKLDKVGIYSFKTSFFKNNYYKNIIFNDKHKYFIMEKK